eukprot:414091_1
MKIRLPAPYNQYRQQDIHEFCLKIFHVIQNVATGFIPGCDLHSKLIENTPLNLFLFPSVSKTECDTLNCSKSNMISIKEEIYRIPFESGLTVEELYGKNFYLEEDFIDTLTKLFLQVKNN